MFEKFSSLHELLLAWIDDYLLRAETPEDLIARKSEFFAICRYNRLKLSAEKCVRFTKVANWCGREIGEQGLKYFPRGLDGIMHMPSQVTSADLPQFIGAANWMRSLIPRYNHLVDFLQEVLCTIQA